MRVLMCGSRGWSDWEAVQRAVDDLPDDAIVIEGEADGADRMARHAAHMRGLWVVEIRCTDEHWKKYGRSAGHKRNHAMLDLEPDRVVAFSLGTRGTQGTIDEARRRGIPVQVYGETVAPAVAEEGADYPEPRP